MRSWHNLLAFLLVLGCSKTDLQKPDTPASAPEFGPPASDERAPIRSTTDVNVAISRLGNEKTRLIALEQLISFGSMRIYQVGSVICSSGDPARDRLIEKAADAVAGCADFETIKMALGSSSETLQFWALWNLRAIRKGTADRWATLLPRVRELATCDSDHIRGQALEKLEYFEGQEAFLCRCLKSETCLGNLLRPLYGGNGEGFHDRFNPHVLRLLGHKDEKVRCDALAFIGCNSHRAPMWQITFTDKVVRRVFELSRSRSIKERTNAVYALADLRSYDPKAIRERMIELVKDDSEDVRWRIPGALADQLDRADVQAALAELMRDKSATVRYFAILELGPEKHLTELRALASGPDKKIAQWAAEKILQLHPKEP